jgi:hypothetical protein
VSTGSIVGGIIGAVIGYFVGSPQIGWAVGSAIGGALDPDVVEGPRLNDRSVQVSTYGVSIPIIYGGTQGAGNIIWATDLIEHEEEESSCGGPTVVQHTYSCSFAVLIGEPPLGETILGVRRIWADAKLVCDFSETADAATQAASDIFWQHARFYGGGEDQLPDPTMEMHLGTVSAYKGYCYIVFTDLPLQKYGNRIPQFRFETSEDIHFSAEPSITYEPLRIRGWETNYPQTLPTDEPLPHVARSGAEDDAKGRPWL